MARRGDGRKRPGGSLKRKVGFRQPRKVVWVFCEGRRTEPAYLQALKREPSIRQVAAVDLKVHPHGGRPTPLALVKEAVMWRDRVAEEQGEVDEFWCVFDVEAPRAHPKLQQAVALAQQNEIRLAISNPCFELWLILHLRDQTGWMSTADVCKKRCELDGAAKKVLDPGRYIPVRAKAWARAEALVARHERNATSFPEDNPSSGMYLLLATLEMRPGQRQDS